ncbi:MAG: DUF6152 family protein [Gammaproteobacteria bacterium]
MRTSGPIALCCAFSLYPLGVLAHHSDAPHFHLDQSVVHRGVITEFRFVNPHAYVYFEQTDRDGSVEDWRCELPAAITLRRQGWTRESLVPGQSVTIDGSPARREANHCYLNAFILDDGTVVPREDAGPVLVAEGAARERPLSLENGQPNISGDWATRPRTGPRERPTQTAAARAAADSFEYEFDHAALRCESVGIIHGWPFGRFPNRITQTDVTVEIVYGYMDLERTIYLNEDRHPEGISHSVAGHSIGHWDGRVLVVDTAAITAGQVSPLNELMHSDQYHVVERFWYDDSTETLVREYTVDDPLYFEGPFSGSDVADLSAVPYRPYDCVELAGSNNIRPGATEIGERPTN